jgi:acyl-homoserine lactone acylase PvdQ
MMRARVPALVAAACVLVTVLVVPVSSGGAQTAPVTDGRYQDFGDQGGVVNILPPGQDGGLNSVELAATVFADSPPPHWRDQLDMYGDLVYNSPGLAEDQLLDFFKDASFGVPPDDIERVYQPTEDVTVVRDASFGVPHIFGETRSATMFAQGYTGAEDRLFLMDVLRNVGRARLSEFVGPSDANLAMDRKQLAVAPYTEADLTAQADRIAADGPEGAQVAQDGEDYAEGVTAYINEARTDPTKLPGEYVALQKVPEPWIPEDTIAVASLVGGIFGKGGGGELINACGLAAMSNELGDDATARTVFDDFHFFDDPEAPTTAERPAPRPYLIDAEPEPEANPTIDCDSLVPIEDQNTSGLDALLGAIAGERLPVVGGPSGPPVIDLPGGSLPIDLSPGTSNALLVGAEHSEGGVPTAVFGPQTGYFAPQLLVEKDVHGPGIDARGVSFAGTDIYVQLGRGGDYAFSATSASADNVDQWVLRLCEPGGDEATEDSMGYEFQGECKEIETFQHEQFSVPTAGGPPDDPANLITSWRVERTDDYGPLVARGTLEDGTPVAVASLRTTYQDELGSAVGFKQVNDPEFMSDGFDSFRVAMGEGVDYTFNWFYVDDTDIGYQHSCRCPVRDPRVDPYLPALGDGTYDWQGFISQPDQPFDLNPPKGYLTSWNNKQADGFGANDRQFNYGPTYRSDTLDSRIDAAIAAGVPFNRARLVDAMEDAGTVDLRGETVLPLLLDALGDTAPAGADPRAQELRDRLETWVGTGGHRRDFDNDGAYDDPQAPAIIDAWWEPLVRAMFDDGTGNAVDNLSLLLHDAPQLGLGSAFNGGVYSQVVKDLRQVLGRPVEAPWTRTYCGADDLGACRDLLWDSLSQAAADLEAEFGSSDPQDWQRTVADDAVIHRPLVASVPDIHWINRPTFQQVVQFGVPVPGLPDGPPDGETPPTTTTEPPPTTTTAPGGPTTTAPPPGGTTTTAAPPPDDTTTTTAPGGPTTTAPPPDGTTTTAAPPPGETTTTTAPEGTTTPALPPGGPTTTAPPPDGATPPPGEPTTTTTPAGPTTTGPPSPGPATTAPDGSATAPDGSAPDGPTTTGPPSPGPGTTAPDGSAPDGPTTTGPPSPGPGTTAPDGSATEPDGSAADPPPGGTGTGPSDGSPPPASPDESAPGSPDASATTAEPSGEAIPAGDLPRTGRDPGPGVAAALAAIAVGLAALAAARRRSRPV